MSDAEETIECRIETLLPLWADGDSPTRARDDLHRAKAGLATATGKPCSVRYEVVQECENCADCVEGQGTDEMQFLIAGLDAASRLIIMDGKHPRDEIMSLLREKLALYELRVPAMLEEC
jgi:hypothetical protein